MRLKPLKLTGAVVVISGASSGVGRAAARAFAGHQARLVVAARGREALAELVGECRALGSPDVLVVGCDISSPTDVENLRQQSLDRFGQIDVWVEAAGVLAAGPIDADNLDEIKQLVATNVWGSYLGSRAAIRAFSQQGYGVLINVSSLLGLVPNPVVPAYVMSKFAVRGLSLALRSATAANRRIQVCVVMPGPVDTPIFADAANRTGRELRAIPPAYAPERAAANIVAIARRPRRQITVGIASRAILIAHHAFPRFVEWAVARFSGPALTRRNAAPDDSGTVFNPPPEGRLYGGWRRGARRRQFGEAFGWWNSQRGAPKSIR